MRRKGKAAVFVGPDSPMEIREYPVVSPDDAGVLMRLVHSGICGTDIHILEGRLPIPPQFIPGHEFIGRVIETGSNAGTDALGDTISAGDYAIACVAMPCGDCFNCRQGETANCLNFGVTYVRDPEEPPHFFGGYGEFLHHPAACLVRIPTGVAPDSVAAFPCAGPTAIRAFELAGNLNDGELVVVQGTGPVGLFAIAWASARGCRVVAIGSGKNKVRMKLARDFGAELAIDYRETTPDERLAVIRDLAREMSRGDGADVVFEASGSPSAIPEGMQMVRTLGRYIVPGQYSNSGSVEIEPQLITFKAIRIIGSGQYKITDISAYLDFIRQHNELQDKMAACITHRYSITEANEACRAAGSGESVKAVFHAD